MEIYGKVAGASRSINTITKKLEKLQSVLNALDTTNLGKMTAELDKASALGGKGGRGSRGGGGRSAKSSGGAFGFLNIMKWGAVIHLGRRLGRVVGGIIQSGADYTETLNLWQVAMGDNLEIATEFVDKMNEAYGISKKTLMNAQAVFKNMLGSLGQITDTMAYQLSEGVTQMALDYASLYNVTFDKAFEKFQSALAGQVRPIRSVSGYDITENTIYQLYQQLGGEKSVRNLSRTEKQLLGLLAIFNQMEASGALGDLDKTMESFANQSRVMAEAWGQIKDYAGLIIVDLIESSGLLTHLNAFLIFLGDTLKAVAESMGAIKSYGGEIWEGTTEGANEAGKAIDEVKGKLLDFDKFRALSGEDDNVIGLDQKLLDALSGYSTILGDASMKARELAESLKKASGLFNEDGTFNLEKWEDFKENVKTVAYLIIGLLVGKALKGVISKFVVFTDGAFHLTKGLKNVGKFCKTLAGDFKKLGQAQFWVYAGMLMLVSGIVVFAKAWDNMSSIERAVGILTALASALVAVTIAFLATHNWAKALAIGGAVAGGVLMVSGAIANVKKMTAYADGGMPDKGTMFVAGEAGAEIVYNTPSGQSGVANVQQIQQAMYGALVQYGKTQGASGQPIEVYLDGEKVYQNTTAHAKRRGNVWGRA